MRKTATVIGLLAAAAAFTWANAATVSYKATLASTAEVPARAEPGQGQRASHCRYGDEAGDIQGGIHRPDRSGCRRPHPLRRRARRECRGVGSARRGQPRQPDHRLGAVDRRAACRPAGRQCDVNVHTAANKGGEIRGQLAP